jgi:hypothetical protein
MSGRGCPHQGAVGPLAIVPAAIEGLEQVVVFQQYMRLDIDAYTGFDKNAVRFRAESFVGVGVLRPQAFAVIDLTRTEAKK